jgi:hypothetical protein
MYVNAMMQDVDIKALPPKERMSKIGSQWNTVTEDEKKKYTDLAIAKNNNALLANAATPAAN